MWASCITSRVYRETVHFIPQPIGKYGLTASPKMLECCGCFQHEGVEYHPATLQTYTEL